ncbi:MAG: Y-family DNA polymerase [Bacilli bacterium]
MKPIIFHIDVNNAFLSWTAVNILKTGSKKDIRLEYSVIGGNEHSRQGIVLARSPLAKEKGIKTGETLYEARKKYPYLKVYPPEYDLYQQKSKEFFLFLKSFTPDLEIYSIDECFFNYSSIKHLYGEEIDFAHYLKDKVNKTLGFTVNIGISNNKLLAKMASNFKKPNLVHTLYKEEIPLKMWPLPVSNLFGVGPKTTKKLNQLKIKTIKDLALANELILIKYFKNQAKVLIEKANGIDESKIITNQKVSKGISQSLTLKYDLTTTLEIMKVINKMADNLALKLRTEKRYAAVISVILKDTSFKTTSFQLKIKNPTNNAKKISQVAKMLLHKRWNKKPVRLVGLRLDKLVTKVNYQLSFFDNFEKHLEITKLDQVLDQLKNKHGQNIIKKGN